MSMRSLEKLRDMLCEELDNIAEQGELNTGALEVIDKLVHSVKNIDKIMMADGYSRTGEWDAEGRATCAATAIAEAVTVWGALPPAMLGTAAGGTAAPTAQTVLSSSLRICSRMQAASLSTWR